MENFYRACPAVVLLILIGAAALVYSRNREEWSNQWKLTRNAWLQFRQQCIQQQRDACGVDTPDEPDSPAATRQANTDLGPGPAKPDVSPLCSVEISAAAEKPPAAKVPPAPVGPAINVTK